MVRRVRGELGRAGVDGLVDRPDAERVADAADHVRGHARGSCRAGRRRSRAAWRAAAARASARRRRVTLGGDLVDQRQLVDEPRVDARWRRRPPPASRRRGSRPSPRAAGRRAASGSRSSSAALSRSTHPGASRTTASLLLQGAQRLLQRLGEVAADRHRLADRLHVRGQRRVGRRGTSRTRTAAPSRPRSRASARRTPGSPG